LSCSLLQIETYPAPRVVIMYSDLEVLRLKVGFVPHMCYLNARLLLHDARSTLLQKDYTKYCDGGNQNDWRGDHG
jgi:hypothetical protein